MSKVFMLPKAGKKVFRFTPVPDQPQIAILYKKLSPEEFKVMTEKFGKMVMNKLTKKPEFQVTDDKGLREMLLGKVLVGWEGFVDEDNKLVPFSQIGDYYDAIAEMPWFMNQLVQRILGITDEGDIENLVIDAETEAALKN